MEPSKQKRLFLASNGEEGDWADLYLASFSDSERMSVAELRQFLNKGTLYLHKTMTESGELLCFSLTAKYSNYLWLAYLATAPKKRSGGCGSWHMRKLLADLKARFPHCTGLFLEIESTRQSGQTAAQQSIRTRRRRFYEKLGARCICEDYVYPSMIPGGGAKPGELFVFDFEVRTIDDDLLAEVLRESYEKGYLMSPADPFIAEGISRCVKKKRDRQKTDCGCASGKPKAGGAALGGGGTPLPWWRRLLRWIFAGAV